ncbi:MAG: SusC/RagA family TonB-linked outer membrane protein, partial [Cyclobacteriaceae bacterium]|nr:SusC/RagA family TonB-linked outer membrane protein [Cyclobacteriaceae bacterium]
MHKYLLISILLAFPGLLLAQERTVRGKVSSIENGVVQGLPGANVVITGTERGTTTDLDGNFQLKLEATDRSLTFSYVGYLAQTIELGNQTQLSVTLEMDVKALEEVVVIGYGTVNKSDLTGSVSSVRGSDLTKIPSMSPIQALQGKVPGVQITTSSGAPGSSAVVRIRGVGTFNNASPIYVVDGVILEDIDFLNSGDIESMEVLKDASATAMYGARGANGVIMVTTKQGTKGREFPTINYSSDFSMQIVPRKIGVLSGRDFALVANEITPGSYNNVDAVPNTDWQGEIFKASPMQNHQLSVSGATGKNQYYVGVGYFRQEGIIRKSNFDRLTLKLNNTYQLSKSIRLGTNLTLAPTHQQNTNGNVVFTAYRALPVINPFTPSGGYSEVRGVGNPLADIDYTNSFGESFRTVGNVFAEVTFLKDFVARSSFGLDMENTKGRSYTPVFFVSPQQQNSISTLNKGWGDRSTWLLENTITYSKEINKHRFNAVGGYTMQQTSSEVLNLQGRNIIRDSPDFWYLTSTNLIPSAVQNPNGVVADQNYAMTSWLFRGNYTFNDRFLVTATFRRDGSSKFIKKNRFANFPSVALGWNVINENFMKRFDKITNLKVRASYGVIGNEKIAYDRQFSAVDNAVNAVFGKTEAIVPGLSYGVAGNPNLRWESTYQTDIGIEVGFFNNRLTGEFDYYRKDTRDILISLNIPGYLGNGDGAQITYNAAEVLNRGFEVNLGWRDEWKGIKYNLGANATTIHNETLKVSGSGTSDDNLKSFLNGSAVTLTAPGLPIGSFYGYQTNGIFQNTAELNSYPHRSDAGVGDLRFVDTDKDGKITDGDRVNL